jgi:hypothetical protein
MSDHDYLKQKLYEALHNLFSEKGLKMGLSYAGTVLLQAHRVPPQFRKDYDEIMAARPQRRSATTADMSSGT